MDVDELNTCLFDNLTIPLAVGTVATLNLAARPLVARGQRHEDGRGALFTAVVNHLAQVPAEGVDHLVLTVIQMVDVAGVLGAGNDTTGLAALQTAIDEAKATINAFTYTTADDYQSKFELLQKNADDKKAAIEAKEADGSLSYPDVAGINNLNLENEAIIADVLNTAANREMLGKLADMQAQYEAVELNEDDFTINDWKAISDKKQTIEDALAALEDGISTAKNFGESYNELTEGALKDQIEEAQALIDELKQFAADNQLTPDDVVPGDIDGDGEITGDDVDQFVDEYLAGNLPTDPADPNFARFDANKDGVITIADAVAIFNLSNGLNFDGSDPDLVAARGNMAAELTGTLATQTEAHDGLTRISFILDSNFDYSAFSVDVMTSADVKVVGENALGVSLRSNDLNGVHRIAGLCLGSSVSGNGTVLTLDLEGNGNVQFGNIVFATASGQSISFELGGATGIGAITADQQGTVYSLSGRIVNGMKKGVNIVRDAYGNAKKKLVK